MPPKIISLNVISTAFMKGNPSPSYLAIASFMHSSSSDSKPSSSINSFKLVLPSADIMFSLIVFFYPSTPVGRVPQRYFAIFVPFSSSFYKFSLDFSLSTTLVSCPPICHSYSSYSPSASSSFQSYNVATSPSSNCITHSVITLSNGTDSSTNGSPSLSLR